MRLRADPPHALFLCAIGGWTLWYLLDAWTASGDLQNLGLIGPAALTVLVLCALGLLERAPSERARLPGPVLRRIAGTMALLGLYVLSLDRLGFDLATWLYVLGTLLFLGERRPWMLALVPPVFAGAAAYAFGTLIGTPIPLRLIPLLSMGHG